MKDREEIVHLGSSEKEYPEETRCPREKLSFINKSSSKSQTSDKRPRTAGLEGGGCSPAEMEGAGVKPREMKQR